MRTYTLNTSAAAGPGLGAGEMARGPIDFQKELNPQQLAAVTSPPGHALVIAGAGSGKTRTLTYRVAYLLENAIAPENILLLTFTNKSAREMLERVNHLLPGKAMGLWGGTFHSIGNRILRRHAEVLGYNRQFTILDADDQKSLLQKVIDDVTKKEGIVMEGSSAKAKGKGKKNDGFPKAQVVGGILSLAANTCEQVEDVIESKYAYFSEIAGIIAKIGTEYSARKKRANSLDFDDLLLQTVVLIKKDAAVRAFYQKQFQFILVDEYQDTNALQSEFIDLLSGPTGSVMVVGDDAQSIYSWRGANFENILKFQEQYPGAQMHKIETNYRSVPEILALANQSIKANTKQFEKNLSAARPSGDKPVLVRLDTPSTQAQFVAQRLRELNDSGIDWKDMAVLYRAHHLSMEVQMQLTQDRIPFVITSGLRFFEQAHIKDVCALMKWAANPLDEVAFERFAVLLPGVGAGAAAKLWSQWQQFDVGKSGQPPASYSDLFSQMKPPGKAQGAWEQIGAICDEFLDGQGGFVAPSAMISSIVEGFYQQHLLNTYDNARERQNDITQLSVFADRFTSLEEMLAELALLTNADDAAPQAGAKPKQPKQGDDAVSLTSVHQSKGLEWKVVFIIWLADGQMPNKRVIEEGGLEGLEEERRLFYVSLTRAMDQLYMSYPEFWPKAYSGDMYQSPSMFLDDFSSDKIEEWQVRGRGW